MPEESAGGTLHPRDPEGEGILSPELLGVEAPEAARRLLGCRLRSTVGGRATGGRIVEVEAYAGPHDPASHAAERIGRTDRNEAMFGPPGTAYVYLIYGIHWCLNVVTGDEGYPAAVLVRALEPTVGADAMRERRGGGGRALSAGPGRLCEALGITGELDGHPLQEPPLLLLGGDEVAEEEIEVTGRVGVTRAEEWPLRFLVGTSPHVSRARVARPAGPPDAGPSDAGPSDG